VAGTDVAKLCGITPRDVYAVLNVTPVERGKRAAKRRALWAQQRRDGLSLAEIARRSGVSPTAVREGLKRAACTAAEGVAS
jgi:predicted ArsR family transcriptional regulator